jgi:hypothetical protein
MVCRNLCERLYSKIIVGESYGAGKKYCRRCVVYFTMRSSSLSLLLSSSKFIHFRINT